MPETPKLDIRIKRLTAIEAACRTEIKRAHSDMRSDPERKRRYERIVAKYERKMEKLLPKIRKLRELRHSAKVR